MSIAMPALPPGFTVRAPRLPDDADAIAELIAACETAEYGSPDPGMIDGARATWQRPDFAAAADGWLVAAPDGALAGYAQVGPAYRVHQYAHAFVHPAYGGRGLGMWLLARTEARTRERAAVSFAGTTITLEQWIAGANEAARAMMRAAGYDEVRHIWGMRIDLAEAPEPPSWPEGIAVRACAADADLRRAYAANEEAFRDHWHYEPQTYEQFASMLVETDAFDPSLWFLAETVEGGEVAGIALCEALADRGWVNALAVRRPWRGRGVGMALLRHAFAEFARRGLQTAALGVDTQNLTGAMRLYERAGMAVERRYDIFEKSLPIAG